LPVSGAVALHIPGKAAYPAANAGGPPPDELGLKLSKQARKPSGKGRRRRQPRRSLGARVRAGFGALVRAALRLVWAIGWRTGLVATFVVALSALYFYVQLPPVSQVVDGRARGSVTMLDRDGNVFAWRGEQFGGPITPATVSPHLVHAILATEDRGFYRHFGISPRGILLAMVINLREGRGPFEGNGGSTITQQVAKLLCLGRPYDPASGKTEAEYERECRRTTLWRKLKEVPFAFAMEARYSKDEILTIYLNRAYLGAGTRGFEAASERYFGKSAAELSISEAAMLAGLLKAPSYYAPTANLERARARANLVIGLMEDAGFLSREEADRARAAPASLSQAARQRVGGYFADWVMSQGPDFLTQRTTEDVVIRTTFDPQIQAAAEEALRWVFENKVREGSKAQAAIVVMSADGAVRAMVGGRDTAGVAGMFNRATQARRQTGSAFKPFVYAAALDLGYRFDSVVEDAPISLRIPGSGTWSPRNYDGEYRGPVTLTDALRLSLNTVAVRVATDIGLENVRKVAEGFGLSSDLAAGPALALGASEATLLEMTGAYAGILNGGSAVAPYGLVELRLRGDDAPLMGQGGGMRERVISKEAARQLVYMMHRVVTDGTGRRAALPDRPAAGKTGTTQAARDAWFIGFTADYVAGVWMGYDDNTPLTGVTGGGLPAEIWRETMVRLHKGLPPRPLPMIDPAREAGGQIARDGRRRGPDPFERILRDVLGELFRSKR